MMAAIFATKVEDGLSKVVLWAYQNAERIAGYSEGPYGIDMEAEKERIAGNWPLPARFFDKVGDRTDDVRCWLQALRVKHNRIQGDKTWVLGRKNK
jgi:hypothetical protein